MNKMDKIISEKPFNYVLFHSENRTLLTFLSGGVIEVDYTVEISPDELREIKNNESNIEKLIATFKNKADYLELRKTETPIWPSNT